MPIHTSDNGQQARSCAAALLRQRLRIIIRERYGKKSRDPLFMHEVPHTDGVTRRAGILAKLFNVPRYARPLVTIATSAHDVAQRWQLVEIDGVLIRQRAYGVSEDESISLVASLMLQTGVYDERDVAVVSDAIAHTKVKVHPELGSVFQPLVTPASSLVARIVAFADLGTAGMDGWKAFSREGRLLFHEMYPRVSDHSYEMHTSFLEVQLLFIRARKQLFWFEAASFSPAPLRRLADRYLQNLSMCEQKLNQIRKCGEEKPTELARWYDRVLPASIRVVVQR